MKKRKKVSEEDAVLMRMLATKPQPKKQPKRKKK